MKQAQQAFNSIRGAIEQVNDMCLQIATATDEQSSVIGSISENLNDIDTKSKTTSDNSRKVSQESDNVSNETDQLYQV
ncbi:hypothetical protein, partial [Staphylococcus pasteuri_A]